MRLTNKWRYIIVLEYVTEVKGLKEPEVFIGPFDTYAGAEDKKNKLQAKGKLVKVVKLTPASKWDNIY